MAVYMEQWDYKLIDLDQRGWAEYNEDTFKGLGKEGWKLVNFIYNPTTGAAIFAKAVFIRPLKIIL